MATVMPRERMVSQLVRVRETGKTSGHRRATSDSIAVATASSSPAALTGTIGPASG
jgi:hypothetical protein